MDKLPYSWSGASLTLSLSFVYFVIGTNAQNYEVGAPKKDPVIFCYYSSFSQNRKGVGKFTPEDIDPHLCTHVIFAFAELADGKFVKASSYNDVPNGQDQGLYARTLALKQQNPHLKVLLALGGWRIGSAPFVPMVRSAENRLAFVKNVVRYLRQHNFDGLDMDWEFPGTRGSNEGDKVLFTRLMRGLSRAFVLEARQTGRPKLLLTMAAAGGSYFINAAYEPEKIIKFVDHLLLMTYNYHGSWNPYTGHHSGLYPRADESGGEEEWNQEWTIDFWSDVARRAGEPLSKLVVGLATYGMSFTLKDARYHGLKAAADGGGAKGQFTGEKGILAYYEICSKLRSGWTSVWVDEQKVPYAYSDKQWVGYDNIDSVSYKARYIRDHKLGGAFIWSVEMDDFRGMCGTGKYPLLSTIARILRSQPQPTTVPSRRRVKKKFPRTRADETTSPMGPVPPREPQRNQRQPSPTPNRNPFDDVENYDLFGDDEFPSPSAAAPTGRTSQYQVPPSEYKEREPTNDAQSTERLSAADLGFVEGSIFDSPQPTSDANDAYSFDNFDDQYDTPSAPSAPTPPSHRQPSYPRERSPATNTHVYDPERGLAQLSEDQLFDGGDGGDGDLYDFSASSQPTAASSNPSRGFRNSQRGLQPHRGDQRAATQPQTPSQRGVYRGEQPHKEVYPGEQSQRRAYGGEADSGRSRAGFTPRRLGTEQTTALQQVPAYDQKATSRGYQSPQRNPQTVQRQGGSNQRNPQSPQHNPQSPQHNPQSPQHNPQSPQHNPQSVQRQGGFQQASVYDPPTQSGLGYQSPRQSARLPNYQQQPTTHIQRQSPQSPATTSRFSQGFTSDVGHPRSQSPQQFARNSADLGQKAYGEPAPSPPQKSPYPGFKGSPVSAKNPLVAQSVQYYTPEMSCTRAGLFPHPSSCKQYYICVPKKRADGQTFWYKFHLTCPAGLGFMPEKAVCDEVPTCRE